MRVRPHAMLLLTLMLGGCAAASQLPPGAVRCRGSTAPEVWTVQPGDVLQGVVGNLRGQPTVGAHVRMRPLGADSTAERVGETGRHGAFGIDSVPPGRYLARAHAPAHGVWTDTVELAYDRGTVPRIRLCTRTSPLRSLYAARVMNRPARWMVAVGLADVLATYAYAFTAQALTPPSGPHAPVTYWMAQPWVYVLMAPVAAVATWQGLRQAAAFRAGDRRGWRLPLLGSAFSAGVGLALALVAQFALIEAVLTIAEVAALGAGLGVLLTCINYPLARLLRPAPAPA